MQLVVAQLDAPDEAPRVFHVQVRPFGADAYRPAAVRRAMQPAMQRSDRPRMLQQIAAVPEPPFAVEPQSALLA